jgi:hypothetical protein
MEGIAVGQHVLYVEHRAGKSPKNLIFLDGAGLWDKAERILLALRLLRRGDVRTGRMFLCRPSALRLMGGAESFLGFSVAHPGTQYTLSATEADNVRDLYRKLTFLRTSETRGARRLIVALESFSSIYDRFGSQAQDRILDALIAAEALVGTGAEITFRLGFRIASILAKSDDERVMLLDLIKDYHDVRSAIIHGDVMREKHLKLIEDDEPLRSVIRRLLCAFLQLTRSTNVILNKEFYNNLDYTLLHAGRRADLQGEMGL